MAAVDPPSDALKLHGEMETIPTTDTEPADVHPSDVVVTAARGTPTANPPSTTDDTPPPEDNEAAPAGKFFSCQNFLIVLPNILIPTLYGYHIGLVGAYNQLYRYASDCSLYKAKTACETLSNADCQWMAAPAGNAAGLTGNVCAWKTQTSCYLAYSTVDECTSIPSEKCVWSYGASTCGNQVGYTSIFSGLFAGAMIMGAAVGSLGGGLLTKKCNYRLSFFIIGVIATVGAILQHVATGIFQYWLLFVARIVLGFAMGWQAIAAPSYVDVFAPKQYQKMMGTFFQVFTAFGSFFAAIIAIILGNTISYSADRNANLMGRMQGFICFTTLLSIMTMFLPLLTKNAPREQDTDAYAAQDVDQDGAADHDEHHVPEKKYPCSQMIGPCLIGLAMASTLQLTGINANMNYAPTIMTNLGLDPLVGNIIVLGWNSVTAFGAIPLSRKFSMRTLFLFTTLTGSLCCLFLSGIPVYPGVTKVKIAKEVIAIIGIALFIMSYDFGFGPGFFVLAIDVFPKSFRPIGSAWTTGVMFVLNMVINICYPIATEGISGGPSGNQDKGQSIAFIFFGCIGLVTVTIEFFFLHPWPEDKVDEKAEEVADEHVQKKIEERNRAVHHGDPPDDEYVPSDSEMSQV